MKRLTANWGLKLASLIFAIILWFLVTNINDPVTTVRYTNIPVTLKNTNLITDQGQVYSVLDGSDIISSVTIYAPRSIIDSLSQNNIVATADIQDLSSLNTVSINVTTNKYSDKIEDIVTSSDVVKLSVERKASKSMAITATTSGTLADGYVVGDVNTDQNMIRINGPESVINQVASAVVDVDVTGFTSNIGTDADIILLDADGNEVDTSNVTMNISTVRVNVVIYETRNVPIEYVIKGEPASGYMYTGEIESNMDTVLIAGRSNTVSSISSIKVDDADIDLTGATGDINCSYDLEDYLPTGVYLADPEFSGMVSIVVHVDKTVTETFDVELSNIRIEGEIDGYDIKVDDSEYETVSLTLEGLEKDIKSIRPSNIKGTVKVDEMLSKNSLEDVTPGVYSAEVIWDLPGSARASSTVSVYVSIEEKK